METSKRNIYITAGIALLLIVAALYLLFVSPSRTKSLISSENEPEVKSISEIEIAKRPFVALTPTSNGAEIVMSLENMQEFEVIEYELTYMADNPQIAGQKILRGSTGTDINTKDEKYKKSILLGTASRGVSSPDTGISDGKLVLNMLKNGIEYTSESRWELLEINNKTRDIKSSDSKIALSFPSFAKDYWVIISDTVGLPPTGDFDKTKTILPVLGTFSIAPKFQREGSVTIKSDQLTESSQLYSYNIADSAWHRKEAKIDTTAQTITASIDTFATFAILSSE